MEEVEQKLQIFLILYETCYKFLPQIYNDLSKEDTNILTINLKLFYN